MAPDLAVLLQEKYEILFHGTSCQNRKGWDYQVFNLWNFAPCGEYILYYYTANKVVLFQLKYNKIVNIV